MMRSGFWVFDDVMRRCTMKIQVYFLNVFLIITEKKSFDKVGNRDKHETIH